MPQEMMSQYFCPMFEYENIYLFMWRVWSYANDMKKTVSNFPSRWCASSSHSASLYLSFLARTLQKSGLHRVRKWMEASVILYIPQFFYWIPCNSVEGLFSDHALRSAHISRTCSDGVQACWRMSFLYVPIASIICIRNYVLEN